MRIITILLALFLLGQCSSSYSQVNKSNLPGEWYTKNDDSLFYKTDTIVLYSCINSQLISSTCQIIKWIVNKHSFKFQYINICGEPGLVTGYVDKEYFRLRKSADVQIIDYYRKETMIMSFKVISFNKKKISSYPYDIRILELKRIE